MEELTRRNFGKILFRTLLVSSAPQKSSLELLVGSSSIKVIPYQQSSSEEIQGLKELREYAKNVWKGNEQKLNEWLNDSKGVGLKNVKELDIDSFAMVFDDYINGRRIQLIAWENYAGRRNSGIYSLETRIFEPSNKRVGMPYNPNLDRNYQKRFMDIGIKGDLSGQRDFVQVIKKDKERIESNAWFADGGYQLVREDGVAVYSPSGVAYLLDGPPIEPDKDIEPDLSAEIGKAPIFEGFYKNNDYNILQKRREEAIRNSNQEYMGLLPIIINDLVKQGKLKIMN